MEQTGEYRIAAPRDQVWAALNDPEVLQQCIDGCQSMTQTGDVTYIAAVKAKIGPVSALFTADLELADLDPPNSYTINASAKGGAAGFGKGAAGVTLRDDGPADGTADERAGTLLTYTVQANVGGKLAQIGSRLIDGAARKMADDFFAKFSTLVAGELTAEPARLAAETDTAADAAAEAMAEVCGKRCGQTVGYRLSAQSAMEDLGDYVCRAYSGRGANALAS